MALGDFRLDLDRTAIARLEDREDVEDLLLELGDETADLAAAGAPRDTGAGADSIHAEVDESDDALSVIVGWDAEHFYMLFAEVGTEAQAARPFLRPALDQVHV